MSTEIDTGAVPERAREGKERRPVIVHIVHRRTARRTDTACSLMPDEEGLLHSDEMLPVEETIHAVHGDETAARKECSGLNKTAGEQQVEHYGEVVDSDTWTVTSILVDNAETAAAPAAGA